MSFGLSSAALSQVAVVAYVGNGTNKSNVISVPFRAAFIILLSNDPTVSTNNIDTFYVNDTQTPGAAANEIVASVIGAGFSPLAFNDNTPTSWVTSTTVDVGMLDKNATAGGGACNISGQKYVAILIGRLPA